MGVQDIVNLQITLNSSAPTKAGFGRPAILSREAAFPERSRLYKTPDALLADTAAGITANSQTYRLARALCSQRPRPKDFKVLRGALKHGQIIELMPQSAVEGFVYTLTLTGDPTTPTQTLTYTVLASATIASVCTALELLIEAFTGITSATTATTITVTTTATGQTLQFSEYPAELRVKDVTADPGIATDLAACFVADADWFALLVDSNSEAEVNAAAAWIEDKRRQFVYSTADFGAKDPATTTDVMSDLKALAYFNTGGFYHPTVGSVIGACGFGQRLTAQPGSYTWAHKTIVGERAATTEGKSGGKTPELTSSQEAAVLAKNGNTYTDQGGSGRINFGRSAGGDFLDTVRYIHFLFARIQERVLFTFQSVEKIPFTREGIAIMKSAIQSVLFAHTKAPFNALVADPAPFVDAPAIEDIDPADKANRHLPNVTFSAQLTGAIHTVDISGTVSV